MTLRLLLSCCSSDYIELWIVMVSMVSGCLMYTILVANATTMIANLDPAAKEYKSKVLMGDSFCALANYFLKYSSQSGE